MSAEAEPLDRIEPKMTVERWPADRFYWAVVNGMGWSRAGELPAGLLSALIDDLPVCIDDVHAVAAPADWEAEQLVVCACPRSLLAELNPSIVIVSPDSVPGSLGASVDASRLNLLVGAFEPATVRQSRRGRHLRAAGTVLVCAVFLCVGLLRRTAHAGEQAAGAKKAADGILAAMTIDRREETLIAQVRAMKSVSDAAYREKPPIDAARELETFLSAWPTSISCKPQSVSVSADGLSCAVTVEGDPIPLFKAFTPPAHYLLAEPRIAASGSVTRVNLSLRPEGKGGPQR